MSKIAKQLTASISGNTKSIIPGLNIKLDVLPAYDVGYTRYKISLNLNAESIVHDAVDHELHIKKMKQQIIDEIFREFLPLIHEMRVANYGIGRDRISAALDSLYHQMFIDGLE